MRINAPGRRIAYAVAMVDAPILPPMRRVSLLHGLDESTRARLLSGSEAMVMQKGATLLTEGDTPPSVPLLLDGRVALTATGQGSQRTVITLLGEGDLVIIPPMLLGLPSPVGAVATMTTRVLAIDAKALRAALAAEPRLAEAVLAMLARHWCALIDQMKDLKLLDSRSRVARWLASAAKSAGGAPIKLAAPKAMLARHLGMTPESFSRALTALEAAGAITATGSSIAVLDRRLLERGKPGHQR